MEKLRYFRAIVTIFFVLVCEAAPAQISTEESGVKINSDEMSKLIKAGITMFPESSADKISSVIDLALSGNSSSQWRVGTYYDHQKDYIQARKWFALSAKSRHFYGMDYYANYRIQGLGGDIDFVGGIADMASVAKSRNDSAASFFLISLNGLYFTYKFNVDIIRLYWLEYYADQGINGGKYSAAIRTHTDLYNEVAEFYEDSIDDDPTVFRDDSDKNDFLSKARSYYVKANNSSEVERISDLIAKESQKKEEISPELYSFCVDIFDHRNEDVKAYENAQNKIFLNPDDAFEISESYRESQQYKYAADKGQLFSFDFDNVALDQVLELYFSAVFGAHNPKDINLADGLDNIKVSIKNKNRVASAYINILLEKYNIDVVCRRSGIEVVSPKDIETDVQLVINHLITKWEGDLEIIDGELFGTGRIVFDSGLSFDGGVKHSLPNGSGSYFESGQLVLKSKNFVNGVAMDRGEVFEKGEVVYSGGLKNGLYEGSGEVFVMNEHYEGEFSDGWEHGQGIQSVFRHEGELLRYHYPLDFDAVLLSSFEGPFVFGEKHGEGICRVYGDDNKEDEFSCEFYRDNLIEVAGVSLLPPGFVFDTHFDSL